MPGFFHAIYSLEKTKKAFNIIDRMQSMKSMKKSKHNIFDTNVAN